MNNLVLKNFDEDNKILELTLNRPDVLNSFNREMSLELINYLTEADIDKNVRAIIITGSGRAFCAGQDLAEATNGAYTIPQIIEDQYNPIIRKIRNIEKPIIASVNGVAAGAGANIALACDIVLAAESASFIQAFSQIGLIPDSGGTFTLPRLIGMARATALTFLGDKLKASEAEKIGLIYKSCPNEMLHEETRTIAIKLANMPTRGLGLTKRCFNASWTNSIDEQLEFEKHVQAEAANTFDYQEGTSAFLEKRKPNFIGE